MLTHGTPYLGESILQPNITTSMAVDAKMLTMFAKILVPMWVKQSNSFCTAWTRHRMLKRWHRRNTVLCTDLSWLSFVPLWVNILNLITFGVLCVQINTFCHAALWVSICYPLSHHPVQIRANNADFRRHVPSLPALVTSVKVKFWMKCMESQRQHSNLSVTSKSRKTKLLYLQQSIKWQSQGWCRECVK